MEPRDGKAGESADAENNESKLDTEPKLDTESKSETGSQPDTEPTAETEPTTETPAAGDTPEDSGAEQDRRQSPAGSGRFRAPWAVVAAVTAVFVVLAAVGVAIGVLWWKLDDRDEQLASRDAATRAACDFGRTVGTYDAKSAQSYDDWIARVRAQSTGDWLTMFDGSSSVLKDLSVSAQVHAVASEVHCAWESGDRGRAVVLLSITQTQSSATSPRPAKVSLSGDVTLIAQQGRWLVGTFTAPEDGAGLPGAGGMGAAPAAPGGAAPPAPGQNPPPGQSAPPPPPRRSP